MTGRPFGASRVVLLASAVVLGWAQEAAAQPPGPAAPSPAAHVAAAVVDRVALRFYAPETGGSARPRFITERTLAFEARLEAAGEGVFDVAAPAAAEGTLSAGAAGASSEGGAYQERYVRAAMEQHVAEDLLASLQVQSGVESPEIGALAQAARDALLERVGGEAALRKAADAEGIDAAEIDAMLRRRARAAFYLDHEVSPILHPSEEQLREVYRTSAHPYKGKKFETIRDDLARWFVSERLRVALSSYLQAARNRVRIVVVPR